MSIPAHDIPSMDRFKAALKKYSLKATPQRMAVHEAMMNLGHACADEVCDWIREEGRRNVTVSSVYNILNQMAVLGIYNHRLSSNNKMYFDVTLSRHIHLYDTVNNEFKDILDEELVDIVESRIKGKRFRGYKVDGVDIQILCHPTAKKTTASR